jgi:peptide-methionine (R)-S-oxide reductase
MSNKYENFKKDKPSLKEKLTKLQFEVTQNEGTEPPFQNEYWDHKEEGIYVDIASGEPLFSSIHKFDSGTGWPSFYQPINNAFINIKKDFRLLTPRMEVRSRHGDNHLGHVFNDGPAPTGLRFCINSAALKFIKREDLQAMNYGEIEYLFDDNNKK